MKRLILILLVAFSMNLTAQPLAEKGTTWKYIPKIQNDSITVKNYFKLNGEKFRLSSAVAGQILQKQSDGIWKNVNAWLSVFDSVRFNKSLGLLQFYKSGSVAMADTLDGRYTRRQEVVDSILSIGMSKVVYDSAKIGGQIVNTDSVQTLKRKTLIQPKIQDFKKAMHTHKDSLSGGLIADIYRNVFTMTLPSASTVAGRCSAAILGVDYPSTWIINADAVSPYNLVILHRLKRRIAYVTVFTVTGNVERQLFANAAYSGIVANNDSTLTIESLATITSKIAINLIFK